MIVLRICFAFFLLLSPITIRCLESSQNYTTTTSPHNSTDSKDNSLSFRSANSRPPLLVPSSQFASLSSAFAAVQPGDVIELVASSPCDSNAVLQTANVTIKSSSHALFNCSSSSRAFAVQISSTGGGYVRIEGISFIGGRNSSGTGGAIFIEAGGIDVLISNCSFFNNYALNGGALGIEMQSDNAGVFIRGCIFEGNWCDGSAIGGGLFVHISKNDNNLVLEDSMFIGNNGGGGGGMAVNIGGATSRVNFTNNIFTSNTGNAGGGAVWVAYSANSFNSSIVVNGGSMVNNVATGIGGAVFIFYGGESVSNSVSLSNTVYSSNAALSPSKGGGAVLIDYNANSFNSSVVVNGGSMTNNVAPGGGGAIFLLYFGESSSNFLVLRDTIFVNNSAPSINGGGAVLIQHGLDCINSSIVVNGGSMTNNNSPGGGGALSVFYNSQSTGNSVIFSDTLYANNSAPIPKYGGGAVFVQYAAASFNSSVIVNGGSMINNTSPGGGGALSVVYSGQSNSNSVAVSNTTFSENTCFDFNNGGGAIWILYFLDSMESSVIVSGGSMTNNNSPGGGGALFVFYNGRSISSSVLLTKVTAVSNSVPTPSHTGGAVSILYSKESLNSLIVLDRGLMSNNIAPAGGGALSVLYFGPSSSNAIVFAHFIFSNNSAAELNNGGGAVQIIYGDATSNSSIAVNGGLMSNNIAGGGGGGLSVYYYSQSISNSVVLSYISFSNNSSPVQSKGGGAASFEYRGISLNSIVAVLGGTISHNMAGGGGGGLSVLYNGPTENGLVVSSDTNYSNNISPTLNQGGGALSVEYNIFSFTSSVIVSGGTMTNNIAPAGGGAVFVFSLGISDSDSVILKDTIYSNNSAVNSTFGGGAVWILQSQSCLNSSITVVGGTMINNLSPAGGGGGLFVLFIGESSNNYITIIKTPFINNTAANGGSVMIQTNQGQSQNIQIADCAFIDNKALSSGAVSIVMPQDDKPSQSCLICQKDPASGSFVPKANCGFMMSSQYCQQQDLINMVNYIQSTCVPYHMNSFIQIANSSFIHNVASSKSSWGGGLSITNGQIIFDGNNLFVGNTAGMSGGAFALAGTSNVIINGNLTIGQDNTAATDTAISMSTSGSLMITGTITVDVAVPIGQGGEESTFDGVWLNNIGDFTFASSSSSSFVIRCPLGYNVFNPSMFNIPVIVGGYPNPMTANNIRVSCTGCPYGEYGSSISSIEFSNATMSGSLSPPSSTCVMCPGGAICSGIDNVRSKLGYWGQLVGDNGADDQSEWRFTMCPSGYCCGDSNGCDPTTSSTTACAKGRNVSVALCGSCLDGYSQNIANSGCTLDEECDAGRWAWAVFILISLGWLGLLLVGGDNDKQQDADSKSSGFDWSWFIPSFMFFYQNCELIFEAIGSSPHSATVILSWIVNIFPSSSSSSAIDLCVMRGLSTESKYGLHLLFPACVGGGLIILSLIARTWYWMRRAEDRPFLRRTQRAAAKLVVLFYTTVLTVIGTLLNCVSVNGDDNDTMVILHAGGVVCYTAWQKGLMAVGVCLLIPLPFLMFGVQLYGHSSGDSSVHRSSSGKMRGFLLSTSAALRGALEGAYQPNRWMWPAVVLIRRLLAVVVLSFGTDPAGQARWFCVLFLVYFATHLIFHPFKSSVGNVIEAMNLSILVIISLCEVQNGVLRDVGLGDDALSGLSGIESPNELDIVVTVLFLVPAFVSVVGVGGQWLWSRSKLEAIRIPFLGKQQRRQPSSKWNGVEMSSSIVEDPSMVEGFEAAEYKYKKEIESLRRELKEKEREVEKERLAKEEIIDTLHRRLQHAGLDD